LSQRRHGQPSLCRIKISSLRVVHLMPILLTQALYRAETRPTSNRDRQIGRLEGMPVTHIHPTIME